MQSISLWCLWYQDHSSKIKIKLSGAKSQHGTTTCLIQKLIIWFLWVFKQTGKMKTKWKQEYLISLMSQFVCLIVPSCVLLHLWLANGCLRALSGCRILLSIVYLTIRFKLVVSKEWVLLQFGRTVALYVNFALVRYEKF